MSNIVFLVVMILTNSGSAPRYKYHVMPTMAVCQECVETAKIDIAKGGDAESVMSIYCAYGKGENE